jgi:hypothetical protein
MNDHESGNAGTRGSERETALLAGLKTLANDWRHVEAPARVEAGLRAAFRMQFGSRSLQHHSRWTPVLVWAAAAAATFFLAVALLRPGHPTSIPSEGSTPRHSTPVAETASADDSLDLDNDFIPVPHAAKIDPNEDVNLVRVEVPRSAMMAMGIPINADNASDKVLADVVLGADGMARAVRLVNESAVLNEEY